MGRPAAKKGDKSVVKTEDGWKSSEELQGQGGGGATSDLRAEIAHAFQVKINRTRTDHAAAGQRHARLAETSEQRTQNANRTAHLADQIVVSMSVDLRRLHRERAAVPLQLVVGVRRAAADGRLRPVHHRDVLERTERRLVPGELPQLAAAAHHGERHVHVVDLARERARAANGGECRVGQPQAPEAPEAVVGVGTRDVLHREAGVAHVEARAVLVVDAVAPGGGVGERAVAGFPVGGVVPAGTGDAAGIWPLIG